MVESKVKGEDMYDKELLELKKKLDKMLAPKTAEYKQGYKDGYAKAIDDFAEQIRVHYALRQELGYSVDTYEGIIKHVFEYAEKLKGGAE